MAKHYDEAEKRYIEAQGRFDETTSAFLARELTHIRAQVLQVKKAPLPFRCSLCRRTSPRARKALSCASSMRSA